STRAPPEGALRGDSHADTGAHHRPDRRRARAGALRERPARAGEAVPEEGRNREGDRDPAGAVLAGLLEPRPGGRVLRRDPGAGDRAGEDVLPDARGPRVPAELPDPHECWVRVAA